MHTNRTTTSTAAAAAGVGRDWSDLTPVCLVNIFARLSLADRWTGAMLACRSWFAAATDASLFQSFDLDPAFAYEASESGRPEMGEWWTPLFERRMDSMVMFAVQKSEGGMKEVRVRHCSDRAVLLLADRSPNLEILTMRSSQNVTDISMFKIASGCPVLRELDISYCYGISYKSIEVIGQNCPNLTVLKRNLLNWIDPSQHVGIIPDEYLMACPQDGDREASAIARFMPRLKHLELQFSKLTARGLFRLSEGCGDLEYLDLFGCPDLTSRGIEQASSNMKNMKTFQKPHFYIPRSSVFQSERYGHWRLYDERFQTNVFQL